MPIKTNLELLLCGLTQISYFGGLYGLNLNFFKKEYGNVFSRLGIHLTNAVGNIELSDIEFSLDLAWQSRITSIVYCNDEAFIAFGDPFIINGRTMVRNSFDGALTVSKQLNDTFRFYVELGGQAWSGLATYNALAGIEASW